MVKPSKIGVVISQGKMDKTVKIRLKNVTWNKTISKYIVKHRNMLVHDELNKCREGDVVRVQYVRPLSPRKSWAVAEFLRLKGSSWQKYSEEIPGQVQADELKKLEEFQALRKVRDATNGTDPRVIELRNSASTAHPNIELNTSALDKQVTKLSEQLSQLSFLSAEAKRIVVEDPEKANSIISGVGRDPLSMSEGIKRNIVLKHLRKSASQVPESN